ncbi:MAG: hypothetical protein DYH08_13190 [Actinobacteria bacterium ATB1]|nr:hypothetical protein [Actinobacteria bacterium ATB1]
MPHPGDDPEAILDPDPVSPVLNDLVPAAPPTPRPARREENDDEGRSQPPRRDDAAGESDEARDNPPEPDPPEPTGADQVALGALDDTESIATPGGGVGEVLHWLGDVDASGALEDAPGNPLVIAAALAEAGETEPALLGSGNGPIHFPSALETLVTGDSSLVERWAGSWAADPEAGQARVIRSLLDEHGADPSYPHSGDGGSPGDGAAWRIVDANTSDADLGGTIDSVFPDS